MIDIFGVNGYIRYFCTRFPRDGKPWNWHSDRNGYWTPANFSSFALILTKNNAAEKKFGKKTSETFGSYLIKFLPLHPLLKRKQSRIDLLTETVLRTFFFSFYLPFAKRGDEKKKKEKKTSENIWSIYLKVLTFASAFWKEKQFKKEAIFEEFT